MVNRETENAANTSNQPPMNVNGRNQTAY